MKRSDTQHGAQQIVSMFSALVPDPSWSFEDLTPSQTNYLTHGYHRYPAKFIPQLVERLLDEYVGDTSFDVHVNDPFMGSGTTAVCALVRGYRVSGTDVNVVSNLITRAKSTPIEPEYLKARVSEFFISLDNSSSLFGSPVDPVVPDEPLIEYWFAPDVRTKLGRMLALILREPDERVRRFLLCGFSHILKPCSYWQTGSVKPARKKDKAIPDPYELFEQHIARMMHGNKELYEVVPEHVREDPEYYLNVVQDQAFHQPCRSGTVDIQITSSPYVTSYEYADLHQLSLAWLGKTLGQFQDLRSYRKQFIGTAARVERSDYFCSQIARQVVDALMERDVKLAQSVAVYFADMERCFKETHRILKPGGIGCYVIGNTTLRGVEVQNAQIFAETAQLIGLDVVRIIRRIIPSKVLPQTRDSSTGRFAGVFDSDVQAYPEEYIIVLRKR